VSASAWRHEIGAIVAQLWPALSEGPSWIEAQVDQESAGDPVAVSHSGAVGLLQLMRPAALEMGLVVTPGGQDERLNPQRNLFAGISYLRKQYEQLAEIPQDPDRFFWALAAYNGGRGYVDFNGGPLNTALELARKDEPERWWRWDTGHYWLMHRNLVVAGHVPDYRQIWDYVARIRMRFARLMAEA